MSKKVFIVGHGADYERMFLKRGWESVTNVRQADLVQFTGGEDVSPQMYKQAKHPTTRNNPQRDKNEVFTFELACISEKPIAGICRGGQFLNVMCGGSMWQDVDNHCGGHIVTDVKTGKEFYATSTHHQMMKPNLKTAQIVAFAEKSTVKERCDKNGKIYRLSQNSRNSSSMNDKDMEVLFYPTYKVLCFQPHPEFPYQEKLADWYFEYLDRYLGV